MRIFILIISTLLLSACSASYYVRRAGVNMRKAQAKDSSVVSNSKDTVLIERVMTIKGGDGRDSLIYSVDTVVADCPELDYSKLKSRWEYKQDKKMERKNKKEEEKTKREAKKQDGKTERARIRNDPKKERIKNRRLWCLWMFLGVIIGFFVRSLFRRARDGLIR